MSKLKAMPYHSKKIEPFVSRFAPIEIPHVFVDFCEETKDMTVEERIKLYNERFPCKKQEYTIPRRRLK
jgi:hypothetical protein